MGLITQGEVSRMEILPSRAIKYDEYMLGNESIAALAKYMSEIITWMFKAESNNTLDFCTREDKAELLSALKSYIGLRDYYKSVSVQPTGVLEQKHIVLIPKKSELKAVGNKCWEEVAKQLHRHLLLILSLSAVGTKSEVSDDAWVRLDDSFSYVQKAIDFFIVQDNKFPQLAAMGIVSPDLDNDSSIYVEPSPDRSADFGFPDPGDLPSSGRKD